MVETRVDARAIAPPGSIPGQVAAAVTVITGTAPAEAREALNRIVGAARRATLDIGAMVADRRAGAGDA